MSPHTSLALVLLVSLLFLSATCTDVNNFRFAIMSDLHVGEGFQVYNSTDLENYSTRYLRSAVQLINDMNQKLEGNISFVFVTGDITSSAQPKEWEKAYELLGDLAIPYFPIMGNHDPWTYDAFGEEVEPTGDQQFASTFDKQLHHDWVQHYVDEMVWNSFNDIYSTFQNYVLRYSPAAANTSDVVFICLDWNTRSAAVPGWPGALPNAELFDFEGGTYQWLDGVLAQLAQEENAKQMQIAMLQHQGYRTPLDIPSWAFTFSDSHKRKLQELFTKHFPIEQYWGVFAGHIHRWWEGTAFDHASWATFHQWETDACKGQWNNGNINAAVSLVEVIDGRIDSVTRHHGDTSQ